MARGIRPGKILPFVLMILATRTIRAMPWLVWLPVAALVSLIALTARGFPPDFASRQLYLRAGLMVAGLGMAFIFDDAAAQTTDASPSPLRERRGIRFVVGVAVWVLLVAGLLLIGGRDMDVVIFNDAEVEAALPAGRLLLEGLTMAAFGLAIAAVMSKHWDHEPGKIASAGLLMLYAASWAVPERWKPWAHPSDDRWTTGYAWWSAALALAVLITMAISWDTRLGVSARRLARTGVGKTPPSIRRLMEKDPAGLGVDQ